jgi:toxin FitB
MIILDTNVFSEIFKPTPAGAVMQWLDAQDRLSLFLTTVTQAEVLYGIEMLPAGKRARLSAAIGEIITHEFYGRILSFDEEAAAAYAKIAAGRAISGHPISQSDAMIAAVARARGAAIATRNTTDFEHCGITIVNPWRG